MKSSMHIPHVPLLNSSCWLCWTPLKWPAYTLCRHTACCTHHVADQPHLILPWSITAHYCTTMSCHSVRRPLVSELLLLLILAGKRHAEEQFWAQLGLSSLISLSLSTYDNLTNRSSDGEEDELLLSNRFSGEARKVCASSHSECAELFNGLCWTSLKI
jgi:hypothetical protein